jgi:hypothetical protein
VEEAVRAARTPFLESDEVPSPDGTPPGHDMQWPGTELQRSEWFADIQQSVIERRLTMSARDYVGHLSTISAYLQLPISEQEQVYSRITQVLPETVEIAAEITVHLARRRCERSASIIRCPLLRTVIRTWQPRVERPWGHVVGQNARARGTRSAICICAASVEEWVTDT